jgi:hypothetical protein
MSPPDWPHDMRTLQDCLAWEALCAAWEMEILAQIAG